VRTCLVINGSRHEVSRRQMETGRFDESWRLHGSHLTDDVDLQRCDGLLVFGGDTAYGILKSIGFPALRPIGEIVPGVPVSRIEGRREVLITKAGGFGQPDLISELRSKLE